MDSRLSLNLPRSSFWKTTLTDFQVLCTFPLLISTCNFRARASSSPKYCSHFKSGSCVGSASWGTGSNVSSAWMSLSTVCRRSRSLRRSLISLGQPRNDCQKACSCTAASASWSAIETVAKTAETPPRASSAGILV